MRLSYPQQEADFSAVWRENVTSLNTIGRLMLVIMNSWPRGAEQVQINDDFCGMDVNTPLGGSMPIEATPVLTYSGLLLTSVAATSTHDYTVAFMGTATGHLKKQKGKSSITIIQKVHTGVGTLMVNLEPDGPKTKCEDVCACSHPRVPRAHQAGLADVPLLVLDFLKVYDVMDLV
ncbi:plexin-A4-like protein [Trichonephila clavipes]|nr:plexin-A4-like protein [Trichonephila clavipes]